MISEEGIVKEIKGNKAIVKVERSAACKHCSARGSCGMDLESQEVLIEVENRLHAKVGDKVELSVPSGSLLKMAILVYILPILSLLLGAYEGGRLALKLSLSPSTGSILGALILLIISFCILKKIDKAVRNKESYKIQMTKILS